MKINGKEVIEIRPMTRYEYKNHLQKQENGGKLIFKKCEFCKSCFKAVENCDEMPAYVNGKFKMIVKVR